ncbi:MAG: hypothetical protein AB7S71_20650 [Dongiaceae bacterium]
MWDDDECQRRRLGRAELLSSWAITAAMLIGLAAWSGLHALLSEAPLPAAASSDASAVAIPLILRNVAPEPRLR